MVKLVQERPYDDVEMRVHYCTALIEAASQDARVFVMDCDLSASMGTGPFREAYPHRYLNCGIQEQNACSMAAGMARRGFIPFVHTFGAFASRRMYDQIFLSCAYQKAGVKIVGGDPGVSAAVNGGTHMALEDGGIIRCIPGVRVLEPSDGVMLQSVVHQMCTTETVDYLRLYRKKTRRIYREGTSFQIGQAVLLREGTDLTIIASGACVHEALEAADALQAMGISSRVLDMFTWKPIDTEAIIRSAQITGAVLTAENHNYIGGLGSAVAEVLAENMPVPMRRVGVRDQFGQVGSEAFLMKHYGLTADTIIQKGKELVACKRI